MFIVLYSTKDHPKAKGADWQIGIPVGWLSEESNTENIVQKFWNNKGDGRQGISLMILNDLSQQNLTDSQLKSFFSEAGMRNNMPPEEKFISFNRINIAETIGGRLEYEFINNTFDGGKIKVRMIQYQFLKNGKIFLLQCSTNNDDVNNDLGESIKQFYPLFDQVAGSSKIVN